MDWADRTVRNLAQHPVAFPDPRWSPDGSRIAYQRPVGDSFEGDLWVVWVDGTPPIQVTHQGNVEEDQPVVVARWSPSRLLRSQVGGV